MRHAGHVCAIAALVAFAAPVFATEAEVREADQARVDAQVNRDLSALDRLIADDAVLVNSNGEARTKKQYIDDQRGRTHSFPVWEILENKIVMFTPEAAVAFGHYRNAVTGDERGTRYRYARHTRIWIKRGGRWQLLTNQATEMRTPEGADFPKNERDR